MSTFPICRPISAPKVVKRLHSPPDVPILTATQHSFVGTVTVPLVSANSANPYGTTVPAPTVSRSV